MTRRDQEFTRTLKILSKALEEDFIHKRMEIGYLINFKDYTINLSDDQIEKADKEGCLAEFILDEFAKEGLNFQDLKMDLLNKFFKN